MLLPPSRLAVASSGLRPSTARSMSAQARYIRRMSLSVAISRLGGHPSSRSAKLGAYQVQEPTLEFLPHQPRLRAVELELGNLIDRRVILRLDAPRHRLSGNIDRLSDRDGLRRILRNPGRSLLLELVPHLWIRRHEHP